MDLFGRKEIKEKEEELKAASQLASSLIKENEHVFYLMSFYAKKLSKVTYYKSHGEAVILFCEGIYFHISDEELTKLVVKNFAYAGELSEPMCEQTENISKVINGLF